MSTDDTREFDTAREREIDGNVWGRLLPYDCKRDEIDLRDDQVIFSIGRHPGNDLVIPSQRTSSRHRQIQLTRGPDGRVLVHVLDTSLNGTFVNKDKVGRRKWMELRHGYEISFCIPTEDYQDVNEYFRCKFICQEEHHFWPLAMMVH